MNNISKFLDPFRLIFTALRNPRSGNLGVVVQQQMINKSLSVLIAIMTFLAGLTLFGVNIVKNVSNDWQKELNLEATIVITPDANFFDDKAKNKQNLEKTVNQVTGFLKQHPAIANIEIISAKQTENLLRPWLGDGLGLEQLPIPQLIAIRFDPKLPVDVEALSFDLSKQFKNVTLDNHQMWLSSLYKVSNRLIYFGYFILFLVLTVSVLSIVFVSLAVLAANNNVVEVLYFLGAESNQIASQFNLYFIKASIKGAFIGGFAAMLVSALAKASLLGAAKAVRSSTVDIFAYLNFNLSIYIEIFLLILLILLITLFTSHYTILNKIKQMDNLAN